MDFLSIFEDAMFFLFKLLINFFNKNLMKNGNPGELTRKHQASGNSLKCYKCCKI